MADSTQDQKDYQDYLDYQHYIQASQQTQNPQRTPDAADKAAQGNNANAQPTMGAGSPESVASGLWRNGFQGVKEALRSQAQANGDKPMGDDLGAAALAMPIEAAPAGLAKLATYLGGSGLGPALSRVVANAGIGGIQGGTTGAVLGGALGAAGEAAGGIAGGIKNLYQTGRMALNPARTQGIALNAIEDATGKLKSSEAENLAKYLGDKTLSIDTTRIRGVNPEIDEILGAHASKLSPYGDIPSELKIPAQDANKIRSLLDQEMSYKKLGPYAQTAETAARDAQIKPLADQLRGQVHDLSPDVSNTLDQWSDNLNAARNLDKRAETAPMTVLSSPSFDRRALLQKVDEQAGTDLQGLGAQITNAKDLSNAFHNGGIHPIDAATTLGRAGVQGSLKGNKVALPLEITGHGLGQGLFGNQQK